MDIVKPPVGAPRPALQPQAVLMERAKDLEAAFLAEMLSHAGLEPQSSSAFSGGIGEEQFASFLRQEQAKLMVERGGIGLAESLFRAMGGEDEPS